jgi:hypothetical protein
MPSISREIAKHALKIRSGSKPVKQRLHRFDKEKRRSIGEEISKLLAAGFIKEMYHPEWLANPILVRKKVRNGECVSMTRVSIRKCITYCDLFDEQGQVVLVARVHTKIFLFLTLF